MFTKEKILEISGSLMKITEYSSNPKLFVFSEDAVDVVSFYAGKWQKDFEEYKNDFIKLGGTSELDAQIIYELWFDVMQFNKMK